MKTYACSIPWIQSSVYCAGTKPPPWIQGKTTRGMSQGWGGGHWRLVGTVDYLLIDCRVVGCFEAVFGPTLLFCFPQQETLPYIIFFFHP